MLARAARSPVKATITEDRATYGWSPADCHLGLYCLGHHVLRRATSQSADETLLRDCTSHVIRHSSHIIRHTSHTSHVIWHTSHDMSAQHATRHPHVTPHGLHDTRHTSHFTLHTSYIMRHTLHAARCTLHAYRFKLQAPRYAPRATRHSPRALVMHTPHATRCIPLPFASCLYFISHGHFHKLAQVKHTKTLILVVWKA